MTTTFAGHPLALRTPLDDASLLIELAFATDPADPAPAVRTEPRPDGWHVSCVNFDDASGRGSAEPVLLGEFRSDLLFLHFRAFRYGRTVDHTVHYTIYAVDKAEVGWTPRSG